MNGSYYKTPVFINEIERQTNSPEYVPTNYPMEQSYIENILRHNKGISVIHRISAKYTALFLPTKIWLDKYPLDQLQLRL